MKQLSWGRDTRFVFAHLNSISCNLSQWPRNKHILRMCLNLFLLFRCNSNVREITKEFFPWNNIFGNEIFDKPTI